MSIKHISAIGLSLVLLATVVAAAVVGLDRQPAGAAPSAQNALENVIVVNGTGTVRAEPDIATINLGVEVNNTDVQAAVAEANQRIEAVTSALLAAGIAEEDIQTQSFDIFQERFGPEPVGPQGDSGETPPAQFRVINIVSVTVRDIDAVGEVLSTAIEAGANAVRGLHFGIEDRDELVAQARQAALADARDRAEQIAGEIEVSVVAPVRVDEHGDAGVFSVAEAGVGRGGGSDVAISTGRLEVNVSVTVTYRFE